MLKFGKNHTEDLNIRYKQHLGSYEHTGFSRNHADRLTHDVKLDTDLGLVSKYLQTQLQGLRQKVLHHEEKQHVWHGRRQLKGEACGYNYQCHHEM